MKTKISYKKLFFICVLSLFGMAFSQSNLLENPVTLDNKTEINLKSSLFKDTAAGFHLTVTYKNVKSKNHQLNLYSGNGNLLSRGALYGASVSKGTIYPEKASGQLSYVFIASDVSAIKKGGLKIKGEGLKITKIVCEEAPVQKAKSKEIKAKVPELKVQSEPAPVYPENSPVAKHGKLKVKGAYLYDQNDEKFMLYGMSTHGLAWFPQYVNKAGFKTLRDEWNTNCVRLALYVQENGGYCAGGNQEKLKNLIFDGIEAASELGMYVVVDWHVLSYNPVQNLDDAMLFFSEISQKYAKYTNVIYELCNEPTGSPWNTAIKPYAENLIPMIRKNSPDSIIIVGTNTWSQDIQEALKNPLNYKNVMYAFHFYADTHRESFRKRVEDCINGGLPVIITEFGTCNSSGNGGFNISETEKWFDLIQKYNISHFNWSLANKAETASIISPGCTKTSAWTYDELTDSGRLIFDHFNKLKP